MNRMKMHGRAFWRVLAVLVLLGVAGTVGYGWVDYQRFVRSPLAVSAQTPSVDVGKGSNLRDVVGLLRGQNVTTTGPLYWRVLAEQLRVAGRLHAGEYALTVGMTPRDLLLNMAVGKVVQRNFTIVDGWTFRDLRQALAKADKLRQDGAGLDDAQLMAKIGAPGEMPEGRFLPETYAYVKGDSDLDILRRAHVAMAKMLDALWPQRDDKVPLATPYDALILASIVEKETGRADERPRIAGVFARRLQSHMLLQTDPTVIYGMGDKYDGKIHKKDLETDTPYNTYVRAGLPPTPIALPGVQSLQAALSPAKTEALYFVSRGDGTSKFSENLTDHNKAVNKFQKQAAK